MLSLKEHYLQGQGGQPPPAEVAYGNEEEDEPKTPVQ